jgi:hypothetical protein
MNSTTVATSTTSLYGFVADADNISLCGQRRTLDLLKLVRFLRTERHLNPAYAVVCTNYLNPMEQLVLEGMGFECFSARENADELVKAEIIRMVEAGVRILTLGAGDGGYVPLLTKLKAKFDLRIHLIASRYCLSNRLLRSGVAEGITYLEHFAVRHSSVAEERSLFPWARAQGAGAQRVSHSS